MNVRCKVQGMTQIDVLIRGHHSARLETTGGFGSIYGNNEKF